MTHTVVGIFNTANEARAAVDQLLSNGFDEANVDYADPSLTYANDDATLHNENESGVSRFFKNLFGNNDEEGDRYSRVAKDRFIVTVYALTDEEANRAGDMLDEYGAINVDENDQNLTPGNSTKGEYREDRKNEKNGRDTVDDKNYFNTAKDETTKIPIIEESLNVGKKIVETGGVRLRSRIIEKPVEQTIRLREEYVNVDRKKVDRALNENELSGFKEGVVEMMQHAEVPVVTKDARVVEEVSINKNINERDETIQDKVRRTDVDVEDFKKKN